MLTGVKSGTYDLHYLDFQFKDFLFWFFDLGFGIGFNLQDRPFRIFYVHD